MHLHLYVYWLMASVKSCVHIIIGPTRRVPVERQIINVHDVFEYRIILLIVIIMAENGSCLTWLATSLEEKRRWLVINASPRGQCSK